MLVSVSQALDLNPHLCQDPENAADGDDYSEYWQSWSLQLDIISRVAVPALYIFCILGVVGSHLGKLLF